MGISFLYMQRRRSAPPTCFPLLFPYLLRPSLLHLVVFPRHRLHAQVRVGASELSCSHSAVNIMNFAHIIALLYV